MKLMYRCFFINCHEEEALQNFIFDIDEFQP